MSLFEVNFDTLVGPTHHFGGLSIGNVASMKSKHIVSNPKKAALQGLEKMKLLFDLGIKQGIFPPAERPSITTLRSLGFTGNDTQVIASAFKYSPKLFYLACTSSSMWTANMATVAPSSDTADKLVHITPANLCTMFHRSIETDFSSKVLKTLFADPKHFVHHEPLPSHLNFADEGAANHIRFSGGHHLFVYGRSAFATKQNIPKKFPARQTREASESVARVHLLPKEKVLFAQQNPKMIDAGVFHNDVISTGHEDLFFYYEDAFCDSTLLLGVMSEFATCIKVYKEMLSLKEAVSTYLFNSQIVSVKKDHMAIIAPIECKLNDSTHKLLKALVIDKNPIKEVHFVDLKESMQNGGGPACLRLRFPLNETELNAVHKKALFSNELYEKLKNWIHKHYRDSLSIKDLNDPLLLNESREALDELTVILGLKKLYDFQQ